MGGKRRVDPPSSYLCTLELVVGGKRTGEGWEAEGSEREDEGGNIENGRKVVWGGEGMEGWRER